VPRTSPRLASLLIPVLLLVVPQSARAQDTVRGRVTDLDGNPIAGVEITCCRHQPSQDWVPVGTATTNADGTFELALQDGLPVSDAHPCHLCALAEGWAVQSLYLWYPGQVPNFVLLSAGEYTGLVTDDQGRPIAGARVTPSSVGVPDLRGTQPAYSQLHKGALADRLTATTDCEGRFSLDRIPEGADVGLTVEAAGFGERELHTQTSPAEIRLTPAGL